MRRNSRGEQTRRVLVEAAIAQLAEQGVRGLTHRLVEERADQAQGSVKHHFGSLDGLVEAVLQHIVAVELPLVVHPGEQEDLASIASRAQQAFEAVWTRPDLVRARLELYVYAAGRPRLQQIIAEARQHFVDSIAASLPGPQAQVAARFVAACLDGLMLDQLSAPHPDIADGAGVMVLHAGYAGRLLAAGDLSG